MSTNLITRTNGPFLTGGAPWDVQDTGDVAENAATAPDGSLTAWTLTDGSGTGIFSMFWTQTVTASTLPYCAWVYVKKAAATVQPMLTLRFGGAGSYASPSKIVGITCNPNTGATVFVAVWGEPEIDYGSIDLGDWWLFYVVSANDSSVRAYMGVGPAIADSGGSVGVGHLGTHTFWTAGLLQGSEPILPLTQTVVRSDNRTLGAVAMAVVSTTLYAIACRDARCVATVNPSVGPALTGASTALADEPGCLIYAASALWTVTADGYVRKLTAVATPVLSASTNVYAATNAWVAACGSVILAPGRQGGVVSLNSSAAVLKTLDGVLSRIVFAVGTSTHLYCFDGYGRGAVVSVSSAGVMALVARFTAADCRGRITGHVVSSTLVLSIEESGAVAVFDVSTPAAPTRSSRTVTETPINGVLNDAGREPLRNAVGDWKLPKWTPAHAGKTTEDGAVLAHGRNAAITISADLAEDLG